MTENQANTKTDGSREAQPARRASHCYLAIAYLWGWTNNDKYFVGCWTDRDTAIAFATAEAHDRGGKYGVTVYEFCGPDEEKVIHHSPSSYGEDRAQWNRRIALFERFGNHFVPIVQGEMEGDLSHKAMAAYIEHENKILDIIEGTAQAR